MIRPPQMAASFVVATWAGADRTGHRGDAAMKNIAFWVVIAFGLISGTVVVMTYHPHHAEADCTGTGC